jgi:hypothetical protein
MMDKIFLLIMISAGMLSALCVFIQAIKDNILKSNNMQQISTTVLSKSVPVIILDSGDAFFDFAALCASLCIDPDAQRTVTPNLIHDGQLTDDISGVYVKGSDLMVLLITATSTDEATEATLRGLFDSMVSDAYQKFTYLEEAPEVVNARYTIQKQINELQPKLDAATKSLPNEKAALDKYQAQSTNNSNPAIASSAATLLVAQRKTVDQLNSDIADLTPKLENLNAQLNSVGTAPIRDIVLLQNIFGK